MPKIGRYEIKRELGRGAMGVVYLAHDPHLHREVALKTYTLPDGVSEEMAQQFHERFLREARAAASLSHPGIVTIYDAGEDPDQHLPYIAMEYVPGRSLKQRLEQGDRLDTAWVTGFGAVLADALHLAHRAGIVHRDIKPANILIRESDGAVKIADFGVARLKSSDLTQSGVPLGSPSYMSPEQVRGLDLDGRSDLFALAVTLYEALCGKRPFKGDDLVALAYSIAHDTPLPLSRQLQGHPAGLDAFFERALSKDPDGRFPDGAAFRAALVTAAGTKPSDRMAQTVVDASTIGMAIPLNPGRSAGRDAKPAAPPSGAPRGGRGRFLGATVAVVLLLAAGLATAAFMGLGRRPAPGVDPRAGAVAMSAAVPAPMPAPAYAQDAQPRRQAAATMPAPHEVEPVAAPAPAPAPLPQKPRYLEVTVPAGTEIHLALDHPVGSASSHAGEIVTARLTQPVVVGDRVVMPVGSIVHGVVREAVPATKGLKDKAGSLTLGFDQVATPFGFRAPIAASMTSVATGSGGRTAATIGGGAAGGAVLGRILGHRSRSAAAGTLVGAAVGTAIASGMKGQEVELPAGASLTVTLDQPAVIDVVP